MEVTFQGDLVGLKGEQPRVGDSLPNFKAVDMNGDLVSLDSFKGEALLISVVLSIDTPVWASQTKSLVEALEKKDIQMITLTRNTPEELRKWSKENNLEFQGLSDDKYREFGKAYGLEIIDDLEIADKKLLARAVFIADKNGLIQYREIVDELTREPDYKAILKAIDELE